jgi:FG-GAP repeat protein
MKPMRRTIRTLAATAVLASGALGTPAHAVAGVGATPSDFNGDGYADLAIAAPREAVADKRRAGAVTILYGTAAGLTATNAERWHQDQPGVKGIIHGNERFGSALATGDFDADGFADLAIGVPNDTYAGLRHAGAVNVLYGSAQGLTAARDQRWWQASLPDEPEERDRFGAALAAGDFDQDGYVDLAIGVPNETIGATTSAGIVEIVDGGPDGLSSIGAVILTRASIGESDVDWGAFGSRLAAGDFDQDLSADLAIGEPGIDGGGVGVVYGDPDGLDGGRHERWTQDSAGILGEAGDDLFGTALAIGDFDGNAIDDIATGATYDFVSTCGASGCNAGAVAVLYGTLSGLSATGNQLWTQDSSGIPGTAGDEWIFGASLAAGDFDGNGADDLAVGAPGEDDDIGSVTVIPGGAGGLTAVGAKHWTQDTPGVPGQADNNVIFGWALASHDFGHSARADLAISAIGTEDVVLLYGTSTGLDASSAQIWSQGSPGVPGSEEGDQFGFTFAP